MSCPEPCPDREKQPSMTRLLRDRRLWLALTAIALFFAVRQSGLASYLSLDTLKTHRVALTN
jgi:hypothetical protein